MDSDRARRGGIGKGVEARAARKRIRTGTAVDDIVAASAIQNFRASAADQYIA